MRAEQPQRHQWCGGEAALDRQEGEQREQAERNRSDHPRRTPAVRVGAHDSVDDRHQAARDEQCPGGIEVAPGLAAAALRHDRRGQQQDSQTDWNVDQEDRWPAERLREDSSEQHAAGRADATDRAPDPKRAIAFAAFGKRRGDDRETRRRDDRSTEALDGARCDQQAARGGQCAGERGEREQRRAADEHASAAEQIRGASPQHQKPGKCQRVGVDDPLQPGGREMQPATDRRQRDVDDRDVEDHHELGEAHEDQQHPGAIAGASANATLDGGVHRRTASSTYAASTTAAQRASLQLFWCSPASAVVLAGAIKVLVMTVSFTW